jgi:hypothetical protein
MSVTNSVFPRLSAFLAIPQRDLLQSRYLKLLDLPYSAEEQRQEALRRAGKCLFKVCSSS